MRCCCLRGAPLFELLEWGGRGLKQREYLDFWIPSIIPTAAVHVVDGRLFEKLNWREFNFKSK